MVELTMEALRDLRASIDEITDGEIDGAALALQVLTATPTTDEERERVADDVVLRHRVAGARYAQRLRVAIMEALRHGT